MSEVPPGPEEPDDVGELYRHASALDASRPSELVRRRILKHAEQLAEERAAENDSRTPSRTRAATRAWRRPAVFGTLAAAALAGLLITPRLFKPTRLLQTASSPAQDSRSESAVPAPSAQNSARSPQAADEQQRSPLPAESPRLAKPHALARNAGQISNSAAERAAKNAPAEAQSMTSARNSPAARETGEVNTSRMQATSGAQPAAPISPAALLSTPDAELRRAAEIGDIPHLQALLDEKTSIDARDESGRTALMLATLRGQSDAVDVLLAHGADPNAADARGTTPLQAALAGDQQKILVALQRAGAR
jgi:hypothetical protein